MLIGNPPGAAEAGLPHNKAEPFGTGKVSVCQIASGDRWAGAEVQLATLMRALSQRCEVALCAIFLNEGRLAGFVRQLGVEVKVIPENQYGFLQIYRQAVRFLRGRKVQVLHSHRYKENLLAALLAWRCRIPFVVRTQHGLPETFRGWKNAKHKLLQSVDRWVARYANDSVISVSADLQTHLTRYINPRKVVTISNGLDEDLVRSTLTRAAAKGRLSFPENTPIVGTAGRLDRIKRLDIFLRAACEIASALPHARFVIAGEGREENSLRKLADDLGLHDKVQLLGYREDIHDVLRAMDVFVLCSDHEGLPMVLLEALMLGTPVVARQVGGVPEVVQNGVNGILVESGDPKDLAAVCLRALSDEAGRGRMAAAGPASVRQKFTAERTADEVEKLYRTLVAGATVPGGSP